MIITEPNDYKKLSASLMQFRCSIDRIEDRRKIWNDTTKKRITDFLYSIRSQHGFEAHVEEEGRPRNLNCISLVIKDKPSGIEKMGFDDFKGDTPEHKYEITGGKLSFHQTHNGKIITVIKYPFIKDIVKESEEKISGTFEPDELDVNKLIDITCEFLDYMSEWFDDAKLPDSDIPVTTKRQDISRFFR